ncbi:DinB family protein [Flavihumibacter sp. R14]|nr:DinB family protein [Flavihumibacter soli]
MELPEATKIRLQSQHLVLDELIGRLSEEQCDKEVIAGKWSIRQQLAHLVRYQEIFFERIQTIMDNFNAVFEPYVAEEDPEFEKAVLLPVPELLNKLRLFRKSIAQFYLRLDSGELSRKGRHTRLGKFSIALWGEFFLLHEAHHIFDIFRMSRQLFHQTESGSDTF